MNFDHPTGATPIDPDEAGGLLLSHITNRAELDRWEQNNIIEAEIWAFRSKPRNLLSADFICRLHKRMFGDVWQWASCQTYGRFAARSCSGLPSFYLGQ